VGGVRGVSPSLLNAMLPLILFTTNPKVEKVSSLARSSYINIFINTRYLRLLVIPPIPLTKFAEFEPLEYTRQRPLNTPPMVTIGNLSIKQGRKALSRE